MLCIVKKTLDTIVATKNHYVVAIKMNSKSLYSLIESAIARLTTCSDYHKTAEKNRGREETRIIHVFEPSEEIINYLPHIQSVVRVKRICKTKEKTSEEIIFYICDAKYSAKQFNKGIRGHWSIENQLHWVKDVVMLEDKSPIRNKLTAAIISLLKTQIIELAYIYSKSVINFQRTIAHDIEQMRLILE
jgi:predicted transposase YbfD/YdcC